MTRTSSEPHRRYVGGVTWTRDDNGRYSTREGKKLFRLDPVRFHFESGSGYMLHINNEESRRDPWPVAGLKRALEEAGKLVRKEKMKDIPHPDAPVYPECNKLLAARGKIQTLGEFLEWLGAEGIFLAEVDPRPGRWGHGGGHALISETTEKLLARYFEIDLDKVETEKRAILNAQRALNEKRRT